jgi:hypothetical protein
LITILGKLSNLPKSQAIPTEISQAIYGGPGAVISGRFDVSRETPPPASKFSQENFNHDAPRQSSDSKVKSSWREIVPGEQGESGFWRKLIDAPVARSDDNDVRWSWQDLKVEILCSVLSVAVMLVFVGTVLFLVWVR